MVMRTVQSSAQKLNESLRLVFTEIQDTLILTFPPSCGFLSQELEDIKSSTLQRCAQKQYNSVIFDLSAVELIDLSEWEALRKLNQSIKLMGPDSWFVGLRTDLIITLISLDAKTQDLNYALGVEEALTESLG